MMKLLVIVTLVVMVTGENQVKEEEMLEGSESQNYGYGYGTKVDGPHGSSTVYVHGFGTDDGYDGYDEHHHESAYGYGHIDPYLNAKHGYGYGKGYGYNQVHAGYGYGHNGALGHHGAVGVGHHRGVGVGHHGGVVAHHEVNHHPGYGAGYGAPTPFVGSGFRYGFGFGQGYGHIGHH